MSAKLNIESQTAKHEKCLKILDMIEMNRRYLISHIRDANTDFIGSNMKSHYQNLIALRTKIQTRLLLYYAKNIAQLSSQPYEVAIALREPNQSQIS